MQLPFTRTRLGILAGLLGATGALTFVAASAQSEPLAGAGAGGDRSLYEAPGDISGPCDEAEHAGDPECAGVAPTQPGTSPTAPTTPTTAGAAPAAAVAAGTHSLPTPGGTVTYRSNGTSVTLVSTMPAGGWRVEVEQSSGREVELDFRAGGRRVQVNLEIEDGRVRERVRLRDDATGLDVRTENGVVVADDHAGSSGSGTPGSGGSGSGTSGSGTSGSGGSGSGTSGSGTSGSGTSGSGGSGSGTSGSGS